MRHRFWMGFLLIALAACQPSPATVVYVVVTSTPVTEPTVSVIDPSPLAPPVPTATPFVPTAAPATPIPPSATPDMFPTNTVGQIQVAEQVFENGRMFWLQPNAQIWVMILEGEGHGSWLRYENTFVEGIDIETDPNITAPDGKIQPVRGFGKLWRENPDVRDALGWAITPEFGYISQYEYQPGGSIRNGRYISGPGQHMLLSLNSEAFCFIEEDSTWKLGC